MKKVLVLWLVIFMVPMCQLSGQETEKWPEGFSSVTLNAGTLIYATPIGITYEHLWHGKYIHSGFSTGIVTTFLDGFSSETLGGYLAIVLMTGKGNNHFEGRLGGSYHPINIYPDAGSRNNDIRFMPVINLGYRFQPPDRNIIYRVSVGTGGFGLGIGYVFKQKTDRSQSTKIISNANPAAG